MSPGERDGLGASALEAAKAQAAAALVIRQATGDDLDGVVKVGRAVMGATDSQFMEPEVVDLLVAKFWTTSANTDAIRAGRTFVAVDGRKVVAMASFGREGGRAIIWKLYVLPAYQGIGLGRRLVAAIVQRLRGEYDQVYFAVHEGGEAAMKFASIVGFEPSHREEQSGMPDLVWLRRRITQVPAGEPAVTGPAPQPAVTPPGGLIGADHESDLSR